MPALGIGLALPMTRPTGAGGGGGGGGSNFEWSLASDMPESKGLAATVMGSDPMEVYNTATITGGKLVIPADNFSFYKWWYRASATSGFAWPDAGYIEFTFQYNSTYVTGAMLFEIGGKSKLGPPDAGPDATWDTNDALSIQTALDTGLPVIAAGYTDDAGPSVGVPNLRITSPAVDTDYTVRVWWDKNATRQMILQINNDPPSVTTNALPTWTAPIAHQLIFGNDTTNPMAFKLSDLIINPTAQAFQMTGLLWQDFDFSTLSTGNLEASDHNPSLVWTLSGTTARLDTHTDAFRALGCPVNNQTSTSTKGLRYSLNSTASEFVACTINNLDQRATIGCWVYVPTLTTNTSTQIMFGDDGVVSHELFQVYIKNNAGQYELRTRNESFTQSSAINLSGPGIWIWLNVSAKRNTDVLLRAYDTTLTQIGTEQSLVVSDRGFTRLALGQMETGTSQSAGTYVYFSHLVADFGSRTTPAPVWPLLPQ